MKAWSPWTITACPSPFWPKAGPKAAEDRPGPLLCCENITFSDGTPLTAQDVVASGQYILNLAKNDQGLDRGFYGNIRYMVSSFTAQDEAHRGGQAARDYYGPALQHDLSRGARRPGGDGQPCRHRSLCDQQL